MKLSRRCPRPIASRVLTFAFCLLTFAFCSSPAFCQIFISGQAITMIAPAVDATGRSVLFGSSITPDGTAWGTVDLYVVGADGAGLRRLTRLAGGSQGPAGATAVSLTPDGLWASFTSLGRGEEVHLLDVARGADKTLAVRTEGCPPPHCFTDCFILCVLTPHMLGDGSSVLYVAGGNPQTFYVVKNDGSPPRNLPVFYGRLAPSPQRVETRSGQVVFSTPDSPDNHDVCLMNLDGSGIRQVTKFTYPSFPAQATISSNGAVIAFVADLDTREAPRNVQIFTVRADGSSLRQITSGEAAVSSPSLNADGTRLAFLSGRDVFLASSDGTGVRPLTNFRISHASAPVLSEDGSRVAFGLGPAMFYGTGIGAICVVNADGSGLRALYAPRSLNVQGILDAAEPFPSRPLLGAVVAGSLVSAFGTNFADDSMTLASSLPLPESLAGISFTMNGRPLPLVAVAPWQINAQIPPEQNEGPAAFEVRFADGTRSNAVAQTVKALGPALFLLPGSPDQAAALHANTGTPADGAHPAQAGQVLEIYASGLGQTVPFVPAGAAAPAKPLATTLVRPEVDIGGQPARVLFSGLAPGLVGIYQVNVVVPEGLRPGPNSVRLRVGNLQSRRGSVMLPAHIWTR